MNQPFVIHARDPHWIPLIIIVVDIEFLLLFSFNIKFKLSTSQTDDEKLHPYEIIESNLIKFTTQFYAK